VRRSIADPFRCTKGTKKKGRVKSWMSRGGGGEVGARSRATVIFGRVPPNRLKKKKLRRGGGLSRGDIHPRRVRGKLMGTEGGPREGSFLSS